MSMHQEIQGDDLFRLETYNFDLPEELIAQNPVYPRHDSRVLLVHRESGNMEEMRFRDLSDYLQTGDELILNETKVIPSRIMAQKETGARIECLLNTPRADGSWEALCRPSKKVRVGDTLHVGNGCSAEVLELLEEGKRVLRFNVSDQDLWETHGSLPLPHYIRGGVESKGDRDNYQTVFAKNEGAIAAPTAGLHFSNELMETLMNKGVEKTHLTLHVGLGTFMPVRVDDVREHDMHFERYCLEKESAERLNRPLGNRKRIAVGTTVCRTLESVANSAGILEAGSGESNLFIYPGYEFKYVSSLLTNFHLPKSTLLMLVSAFAGYELMMEAYEKAVKDRFRFFSYGDAMLIV